jgi:16S rRNA (cytosine1402-N4)-methyltransferase
VKKNVHISVLPAEVAAYLEPQPGGIYLDGTVGGGGHAQMILERGGSIIGIDRDEDALARTAERLSSWKERVVLVHGNYADMKTMAEERGIGQLDGILLDLGVSSNQLDEADRGFSFQQAGPLDMRMNRSEGPTAADLVNTLSREELARVFRDYGEERSAWRIAGAIVQAREEEPFTTTGRLAEVISAEVGGRRGGRLHPATRVFQALRIAVNDEIGSLERGLQDGLDLLKAGGRLAVISFHSLEDRPVKQFFNRHAGRIEALQQGGERWVGELPRVKKITRKAIVATEQEVRENPRARSARLRVAERI